MSIKILTRIIPNKRFFVDLDYLSKHDIHFKGETFGTPYIMECSIISIDPKNHKVLLKNVNGDESREFLTYDFDTLLDMGKIIEKTDNNYLKVEKRVRKLSNLAYEEIYDYSVEKNHDDKRRKA